jgi:glycolate oxidase FAD binding subunit
LNAPYRPAADWELASFLRECAGKPRAVELIGSATKRNVGHRVANATVVSTAGLKGITLYEPNELVMAARAGTPLAQVESELAAKRQMLAFEPLDLGPVVGADARQGTIGAVIATNLSGARRISHGAARDHLLGVLAATTMGEVIKSGGRVMKNVTGVDIARGLTGSWGTLAALTEVTFKVLPAPETSATLVITGLPDEIAVEAMCKAVGTPYEVSGTVHLSQTMVGRLWHAGLRAASQPVTALRVENFAKSVSYRVDKLKSVLKQYGAIQVLDNESSVAFWDELRQLSVLQGSNVPLWRISTAPMSGPKVVAGIQHYMSVNCMYDWSGGLIWAEVPNSADAGATDIRRVIATHGGHATLIRASEDVRAAVDCFQPLEPGVAILSRKLKDTFDPSGVLNPGRMYLTH